MRAVKDSGGVARHLGGVRPSAPQALGTKLFMVAPPGIALPPALLSQFVKLVPLRDQMSEGACTAFARCGTMHHEMAKYGPVIQLSEQNCYKRTRDDMGVPLTEDSGADIASTDEASHLYGVCKDVFDPYDDQPAAYSTPITEDQATDALKQRVGLSVVCSTVEDAKWAIAQGFVVQFGFTCFQGLMDYAAAQTGDIPPPETGEKRIGGHSMFKCGYDDNHVINGERGAFIVRQSWGDWGATLEGIQGYGYLPYSYQRNGLDYDNHCPRLLQVAA